MGEPATDHLPATSVTLTDHELVLLDGAVSEKVQIQVDRAKARLAARTEHPDLAPALAGFIADVVSEAESNGRITWGNVRLTQCRLCGRSAGYATVTKGPRRGRPNYERPLTLPGKELAYRSLTVRGVARLGGCDECVTPLVSTIAEALRDVDAEVPVGFRAPGAPVRRRYRNVRCLKCGWQGHQGQMGKARTLLGDGFYAATCPSCPARNTIGRTEVETTDGFTVEEEHDG